MVIVTKFCDVFRAEASILFTYITAGRSSRLTIARCASHAAELFTSLLSEFSLVLQFTSVVQKFEQTAGLVAQFRTLLDTVAVLVGKVLKLADFVRIILQILDDTRSSVLDQIIHDMESFGCAFPLLWLDLELVPKMFHDHLQVVPV